MENYEEDATIYLGDYSRWYDQENENWINLDQLLDQEEFDDSVDDNYPLIKVNLVRRDNRLSDLSKTLIVKANLPFSNFERAKIWCSEVSSSNFHQSNFDNASLEYTVIKNSVFSNSSFQFANLESSQIKNCDFSKVDFRGANLKNCEFYNTNLKGTIFDNKTILPFERKKAFQLGMKFYSFSFDSAS